MTGASTRATASSEALTNPAAPAPRRDWRAVAGGALVVPALGLALLVYFPITRNFFFSDDFLNLYNINNYSLARYLLTPNGGHLLVVRNAIFYLTYQLFGTRPEFFYWSMLLLHLLNVGLLFRLIRLFTGSALLASFGAALWGASPLNEGTLGWYAVFGHALVATALLIILNQAAAAAARGRVPSRSLRLLWYALVLMAATSFGVGISLGLALPFALWLLLPQRRTQSRFVPPLATLLLVIPVLYAVLTWAYVRVSGDDMVTHLPWTQLLSDWRGMVFIFVRLLGFGLTRLLFGFYQPDWLDARAWYAVLTVFTLCVAVVALRADTVARRRLIAVVLLLAACYGMIAIGRAALLLMAPHDMVGSLFRYHYVGQLLFALVLSLMLARIAGVPAWAKVGALAAWYAVAVGLHARLAPPIDNHPEARAGTQSTLAEIKAAIHAQPAGSAVYIPNVSFQPLPWYPAVFPARAAAFVIFFPSNVVDGRQVYFIEANHRVIELTKDGRRTGGLLVAAAPPAAQ